MTENEALCILNNYKFDIRQNSAFDMIAAISVATIALKEIQQYRKIGTVEECKELASMVSEEKKNALAKIIDEWNEYIEIGTVEECREAIEKQKPKEPVKDKYHHNCCPACGFVVSYNEGWGEKYVPHCENCGQAIRW